MSSVVDVLISSARSVGRSGNPPAFLSFARGASTAAVSLPPLFPPSVGSSPSRSDDDVCRLSSQLFTPPLSWFHPPLYHFPQLFVLFPHWVRKMATYIRTCHCHQSLPLSNGSRHALSARLPIWLRPCSSPGNSCSGAVVTRLNMASLRS